MQVQNSAKLLATAYKKCPFVCAFRYLGLSRFVSKFEAYFSICPFLRRRLSSITDGKTLTDSSSYDDVFDEKIEEKKRDNTYRTFYRIGRLTKDLTTAESYPINCNVEKADFCKKVTVWCSNDYLGMSGDSRVVESFISTALKYGIGSGGTRNISGNNLLHEKLEQTIANWYRKEAGLVFTSCYVANTATISTLGKVLNNLIIFSDEGNHASLIDGIRSSRCQKFIFRHNDLEDLEKNLAKFPLNQSKLIVFESVYSMSGSLAPIKEICDLAKKYRALTYIDEVHAVGLYGDTGSGLCEQLDCLSDVDIISGTFGKTIGTTGGFIVGKSNLVDVIRSYAPGFIFTTSLPPSTMSASIMSIGILQSTEGMSLRKRHQEVVSGLRRKITQLGLPIFPSASHIIPILIGDAHLCNAASRHMMEFHDIYVQPINYPTVKYSTERLRIAPTPGHDDSSISRLLDALTKTWDLFGLNKKHPKCQNQSCECTHTCISYGGHSQKPIALA